MTEQPETVRDYLFEMEDPLNRAEEAAGALRGLADIRDPQVFKSAISCLVDTLNEEMQKAHDHWRQAWKLVKGEEGPKLETAKE